MVTAAGLVDHARWLEEVARIDPLTADARIDLAWRAVTRARDAEREDVEHDTVPRISVFP